MAVNRRVTTQDITWFLDLDRNEQLDVNPPYQRRSVWSPSDRRFFLDTIFRGYPVPAIFLHKQMVDGRTVYAVVDGKQRLQTILDFSHNKIAMSKKYGDARLDGKKWKTIGQDSSLARAFWDYVLPVEFIDVVEPTTEVNEVFDRLNRNSRKLVDQELRHAKFDGWFITFVEAESEAPEWETLGVVTTARRKRMRDVQFLSELLIVILKRDVGGFDQNEINEYYAEYEDPLEAGVPFSEDDVRWRFGRAKSYLLDLERQASAITKHARDFTNLYTLWGVVACHLETLPSPEDFASSYCAFMEEVERYASEDYMQAVLRHEQTPKSSESLKYYQNSLGASTELPQRQERHNALVQAVLGAST